jgi:hypothetical protein
MRDSSKHRDFTSSQFAIILMKTGNTVTKCRKSWERGVGRKGRKCPIRGKF